MVWALPGLYLGLLAVPIVISVVGGGVPPSVWIVAAVTWPFPIAAAVTASRTSQPGGLARRLLTNLGHTLAASLLVYFPVLFLGLAYLSIWRPGYVPPDAILVGAFVWAIAGAAGLVAGADWKYGGGDNWFD
jgi:hypothetical protein